LTPEEIGLQRIIIEAGIMLGSLAQLGTSSLGIRFFPHFKSQDGKNNGFLLYLVTFPLFGILFFFTVFLIFKVPVSNYFNENSELFIDYYYYIFPLAAAYIYQIVFATYSNSLMRIVVPRITQEIVIRIALLTGVLLYHFKIISLDGFVLSIVISYMLAMLVNFLYLFKIGTVSFKRVKGFVTPKLRNEMIRYMLYLLAISLMGILSVKIDIFMVSAKIGLAFTAVYSIAYYMAAIIEMPSRSVLSIISPVIAMAIKEDDKKTLKTTYNKVAINQYLFGMLIFLTLWINVDNLFSFIPNGDFYNQGKFVVLFIGLAKLTDAAFSLSGIILSFSKYYRYSFIFTVVYGVSIILANNWLIPIWGVTGAAVSTFGVIFVFRLFYTFFVWYKSKVHPFKWELLSISGILILGMGINLLLPKLQNIYLDALMRTVIIMGSVCTIVYFTKISAETNNIIKEGLRRLRIIKRN
ncbi:MAG: lipopolysaccharide biosynthesis protein, partial [Bacteroidales bacterium]|nr:lipopolysaccharide biosynthesis protein [Bacteroidales bacterium]